MQLDRKQLGRFLRLVTGHNSLQVHCHRINRDEPVTCRLCGEEQETFPHLLNTCSSLVDVRLEIFGDQSWSPPEGWSLEKLLEFSYHDLIKPLFTRRPTGSLDQAEGDGDMDDPLTDAGSD